MATNTTTNMRIIAIEDTRNRDDDGRIVPESGDQSPCAQCGRPHDVHVMLSDGRRVGTTCARKLLGLRPADALVPAPRYEVWAGADLIGEPAKLVSRHGTLADVEREWPVEKRQHRATWRQAMLPREYAEVRDTHTSTAATLWSCGEAYTALNWQPA